MLVPEDSHPLAVAMWDFSWLERRWPGAGYEDWDRALDELCERGYDVVRIDAYPHLLSRDAGREWQLVPVWTENDWGAPAPVRVRVQPELTTFIAKCAERGLRVALSTWYREDVDDTRMTVSSPRRLAAIWSDTLDTVAEAGLLDTICYVDLCNEWALPPWAPFLHASGAPAVDELLRWMRESIAHLRERYPAVPYCFSFAKHSELWRSQDLSFMDLLELHIWMTHPDVSDFYDRLGYSLGGDSFDRTQFEKLARGGELLYRTDPDHWHDQLASAVHWAADWSRRTGLPLATTESWAIVNYKDWPGLDWGWVKELSEYGVHTALDTGRWTLVCTSNFCGPQFTGMWRDVGWHQQLTKAIHDTPLPPANERTAT